MLHCMACFLVSLLSYLVWQVAFFATVFLVRRAWWAVKGWPSPPRLHASPKIAQLRSCAGEEEARMFSLKSGYDKSGELLHRSMLPAGCSADGKRCKCVAMQSRKHPLLIGLFVGT
jgi:hypothetical protein